MPSSEIQVKIGKPFRKLVAEEWLRQIVAQSLARKGINTPVELGLVLADAGVVRRLNKKYLGKNEDTDVLSFALHEAAPEASDTLFVTPPDGVLHLGEIVVSYPQAVAQAEEHHHSVEQELALLVVHGVLHILGYDDEAGTAEREMRAEEQKILEELNRNGII